VHKRHVIASLPYHVLLGRLAGDCRVAQVGKVVCKAVEDLGKMGNQLVGIAPSQIFPVEHYLTDQTDLQFDAK
jgi:hypothetical protein